MGCFSLRTLVIFMSLTIFVGIIQYKREVERYMLHIKAFFATFSESEEAAQIDINLQRQKENEEL